MAELSHPCTRALLSVVPERRAVDQQILSGETPVTCRFHPRCPVLVSGEADRLGIADRCRGEDPQLLAVGSGVVACHAAWIDEAGR